MRKFFAFVDWSSVWYVRFKSIPTWGLHLNTASEENVGSLINCTLSDASEVAKNIYNCPKTVNSLGILTASQVAFLNSMVSNSWRIFRLKTWTVNVWSSLLFSFDCMKNKNSRPFGLVWLSKAVYFCFLQASFCSTAFEVFSFCIAVSYVSPACSL